MSTKALDVVTILHALSTLEQELGLKGWSSCNDQQRQIFEWLEQYRPLISNISGLKAKASRSADELNAYLKQNGFEPLIQNFDSEMGMGVVSILNKVVQWLNGPGKIVEIYTSQGQMRGFEIPKSDAIVYEVSGFSDTYLVELKTKSEDTVWLLLPSRIEQERSGLEMQKLAFGVMTASRTATKHAGVWVPKIEFSIKPDISWLVGAGNSDNQGQYFIQQAGQQVQFEMDEEGAVVKAATHIVVTRGGGDGPVPLTINRPFYGWFTQKGVDLPMAVFFADWDSMTKVS